MLQQAAVAGGFFDTPLTDDDGVVRRVPLFQFYGGRLYESLAFALARLAQGSPPVEFVFSDEDSSRLVHLRVGETRVPLDAQGAVFVPGGWR